jgi:hypothetical protein
LFQAITRMINPARTRMSVQLPLPYIRPFGSKCFAGGFTPLSLFGLQSRGLTGTGVSAGVSRTLNGGIAGPNAILCAKHPKGKNSRPAKAGPLLTTDPLPLTQKEVKWSTRSRYLSQKLDQFSTFV